MPTISASRINTLKAKIKAEMLRRNGSGSVAGYGATTYDYTVVPVKGNIMFKEHANKNLTPMKAVNSNGLPAEMVIVKETDIAVLETRVAALALTPRNNRGASDCSAGCTGMCVSACTTTCYDVCTGCYTTCTGGCNTKCDGCTNQCTSCTDKCSGCSGCGGACDTNCDGPCMGSCGHTCGYGCYLGNS